MSRLAAFLVALALAGCVAPETPTNYRGWDRPVIVRGDGIEAVADYVALNARVGEMLDASTKCGACFTACPIAEPAGLGGLRRKDLREGVAPDGESVADVSRAGEQGHPEEKGCTPP